MIQLDRLLQVALSSVQTPELFIDIGSSNTRLLSGGQLLEVPTCMAIHRSSQSVVAIGTKAHALIGKTSDKITVVFPIQHGVVAHSQYLELFLRELLKQRFPKAIAAQVAGFTGAVAVPASLSPADKQAFEKVLQRVNLHRLKKVESPLAIQASALTLSQALATSFCSIDIGGQTTSIALLSAGEVVHAETVPIGGVNITRTIQDVVHSELKCAIGWQTAEAVKVEIGEISVSNKQRKKDRQTAVRGKDTLTNVSKTVVVPGSLINPHIGAVIQEVVESISLIFSEITSELAASALEKGIYLSGGGSQFPGLADHLSQLFNCEVIEIKKPTQTVVRGLLEIKH